MRLAFGGKGYIYLKFPYSNLMYKMTPIALIEAKVTKHVNEPKCSHCYTMVKQVSAKSFMGLWSHSLYQCYGVTLLGEGFGTLNMLLTYANVFTCI